MYSRKIALAIFLAIILSWAPPQLRPDIQWSSRRRRPRPQRSRHPERIGQCHQCSDRRRLYRQDQRQRRVPHLEPARRHLRHPDRRNRVHALPVKGVAVAATTVETRDIVLSIGQGTTTVEVTSQANVSIDTTTAQIATTFSMKEVQDLPSATIGLGVLNLSLLTPGVTSSGGLGAGTGPSITGQRPRNNNFTVDGIDNNSKSVTGRCSMCRTKQPPSSSCCRTSTPRNTATPPADSSIRDRLRNQPPSRQAV